MVPTDYVVLQQVPLTSSGKIDRGALPPPQRHNQPAAAMPAQSGLERAIAGVWQDVLQLPAVGPHDRFFALGGNSLLLVRVLDRMRSQLGLTLSLTDLFRYPSIHAVVQHLSAAATDVAALDGDADARAAKQTRARLLARQRASMRAAS
jgi:acyl carrier protein